LAAFHQCPRVVVKQALIDRLRNRAFLRVFGNRIVTDRHQVTDFKFVFNTAANGFMGMKMWQAFDHLSFAEALVDEMAYRRGFDRKVVEIIKEVLLQLCWNL
jgi:hypothetical protein